MSAPPLDAQRDASALAGELQRVPDEVRQHLKNAFVVELGGEILSVLDSEVNWMAPGPAPRGELKGFH